MKTITEHIFEEKLLDILGNHIYFIVDYHLFFNTESFILTEGLARFDHCIAIRDFIYNYIFSDDGIYEEKDFELDIDCKKLKTFFNRCIIKVKFGNNIELGFEKLENNTVYIDCQLVSNLLERDFCSISESIQELILHELLHAYEDYNLQKTGKSLFDYMTDEYQKSAYLLKNTREDSLNNKLSKCIYFLNDHEQNAYFSQLYNAIEKLVKKTTREDFDYSEFREKLKKTNVWKIYFDCFEFISYLKNPSKIDERIIVKFYNSIADKKLNNTNQVYKELNYKWKKFYKKFNRLVPKILVDVLPPPNKLVSAAIIENAINRKYDDVEYFVYEEVKLKNRVLF